MIYLIPFFVFLLDFITKTWILNHLEVYESIPITTFFNIYFITNKGVSFSMFTAHNTIGVWLLIAVSIAICSIIVYCMHHEKSTFSRIVLALVLGGALSNIFDRIRYGAVIDFLDFHYLEHHFPAFNIADSCICIGMGLLLWHMIYKEKK